MTNPENYDNRLKTLISSLPDHTSELKKANGVIMDINEKFDDICKLGKIDNIMHTSLYDETVRILAYVGELSISVFNIEKELSEILEMKHISSPELAKKIWYEKYEELHHPYTIYKNRCFKLLHEFDTEFIRVNKTEPANWDYRMYRLD